MIYIVRHGETVLNRKKVLQGRSNSSLNKKGEEQAQELHTLFLHNGVTFTTVYSSPLERARQTAEIIAGKEVPVITDQRLIEMDYGPYEGASLTPPSKELLWFFSDFVHHKEPDGMESLSSVVSRLGEFLEETALRHGREENILISTHAIAMKGALEYLTPDSKGAYWSKNISNCSVYCTRLSDGKYDVPSVWMGQE